LLVSRHLVQKLLKYPFEMSKLFQMILTNTATDKAQYSNMAQNASHEEEPA
tara:strand:- start:341 stop:493 length:153 start_codon:yes stop_codon:yes gene_type:complete